jgi:hypothetical protein
MAELILLSLQRAEFLAMHRAGLNGDQSAARALVKLWADYNDRELACFLCDAPVERPVATQVLPENHDDAKLLAAPLCERCRDLPPMLRLSRCLKVLKRMYSARNKKYVTFSVNHRRNHRSCQPPERWSSASGLVSSGSPPRCSADTTSIMMMSSG